MSNDSSECLEQGFRLSAATEQRQRRLLAEAQRVEVVRRAALEGAAEQVARALESAGSLATGSPGTGAFDSRRAALEVARRDFVAAALALREAVRSRDALSRS